GVAFGHFRKGHDGRFEMRKRVGIVMGKLDTGIDDNRQPKGLRIEQRHPAVDDARFLETLDAAPAGGWRQANLFGKIAVGDPGILLKDGKDMDIYRIDRCGHYFSAYSEYW